MILIFSIEDDPSTNEVLYWLRKWNIDFLRINPENQWNIKNIIISNDLTEWEVEISGREFKYSDIKSIWYRRGILKIKNLNISKIKNYKLSYILDKEIRIIENYLIESLLNKPHIGEFKGTLNKLIVLHEAKNVGLEIPDSYILKEKRRLKKVKYNYISKPIFEVESYSNKDSNNLFITSGTVSVERNKISDTFFYSLFQKELKKDFEIRTFYLNNKFYSSAILSQRNYKTRLDYRNYDEEYPNRVLPFKLPIGIKKKVSKLFSKLELTTGSIDFVFSKGHFYFLEINPVGQFGMVSHPCNYPIEKEIAKTLIR